MLFVESFPYRSVHLNLCFQSSSPFKHIRIALFLCFCRFSESHFSGFKMQGLNFGKLIRLPLIVWICRAECTTNRTNNKMLHPLLALCQIKTDSECLKPLVKLFVTIRCGFVSTKRIFTL